MRAPLSPFAVKKCPSCDGPMAVPCEAVSKTLYTTWQEKYNASVCPDCQDEAKRMQEAAKLAVALMGQGLSPYEYGLALYPQGWRFVG
jgi:hypothetical protein